jgi:hypothetical protein
MSMRVLCPEGHPVLVDATRRGAAAICPRCLASFLVEMDGASAWHARKEDSRARRPRDDDDEEDEEKHPRKKTTPKKAKHEEEEDEETPRRKKQSRKKVDDEEDEDEDQEDDEDEDQDEDEEDEKEEQEIPIEWTSRKRQLNVGSIGLIAMMVGNYCLLALAAVTILTSALGMLVALAVVFDILFWGSLSLRFLGITGFVVGAVLNLFAPSKIEGRAMLISTLVFTGLVYVLALMILLAIKGYLVADLARGMRFGELLYWGAMICYAAGMLSAATYLSKLMIFMKLHLEKGQPISNMAFILLVGAVPEILLYFTPSLKSSIGVWMIYVIAGVQIAANIFQLYMYTVQGALFLKIRRTIDKYIREA